jgi:hypothetical protein
MREVRSSTYNPGDYYDTVLMRFDGSGTVLQAVQITNGNIAYSMFSSAQGLVKVGKYHFFGGWAYGYQTNLQKLTKPTASLDFDAYVYKYMFDHDSSYSCIYQSTIDKNTM